MVRLLLRFATLALILAPTWMYLLARTVLPPQEIHASMLYVMGTLQIGLLICVAVIFFASRPDSA